MSDDLRHAKDEGECMFNVRDVWNFESSNSTPSLFTALCHNIAEMCTIEGV